MSCHAVFTSCRFVWYGDLCAECFRAAKSTELVPRRRRAERDEEEGGEDAEKLVLYCLFQLFLPAQSVRFLSSSWRSPPSPRGLFSAVTSWWDASLPSLFAPLPTPFWVLLTNKRSPSGHALVGAIRAAASRPAAPAEARSRSGMMSCCDTLAARQEQHFKNLLIRICSPNSAPDVLLQLPEFE